MKDKAQVVIIGGGANGLGTAYQLAKSGLTDVVVLESQYVLYGASGRNGGGVRAQWGTEDNAELARGSIRMFRELSRALDFNLWFRQTGYLFLAYSEAHVDALKKNAAFHKQIGVKSRVIEPEEASVIAPEVNLNGVVAASFGPDDGIIFPWAVLQGYQKKLAQLGVDVHPFTRVTGFDTSGGRIRRVHTNRGTIEAEWVVNAAGCWSRDLADQVGVALPNKPVRHEILATEALKPFIDPMVVDMRSGMYANQDMRGEIIAGMGDPHEPAGVNFRSSLPFVKRVARNLVDVLPRLADVRVLRQWAGMYDVTPDNKPVLGVADEGPENFMQLNGASGHGFMVSPMTTRIVADLILDRKPPVDPEPFLVNRFRDGAEVERDAMTIG